MTKQNSQVRVRRRFWHGLPLDLWSFGAVMIAAVVLAPILSVIWIAFHPSENIWPHLISSVLPRYFGNTLILMVGVAAFTAFFGTATAWLVAMYRFPGQRWLDYALLFPLAIPAYVGAYALVDFLDYAGPLQTAMRAAFGWRDAREYWFPQVRAHGPAIVVLGSALYPYVYLLARAAFREQSGCTYEVARALGAGPWAMFWRVGLPLARPAIATGVALALMETVADYGTVQHFGVQTLTTGVFSTWLTGNNAGGAAQIAGVILLVIFLLLALERVFRRNARFYRLSKATRPIAPLPLPGMWGWAAAAFCVFPFALGFVLPLLVMLGHAIKRPDVWVAPGLLPALGNTVLVGGIAAALTVLAALFLVYGTRMIGRDLARMVLPATLLGYAAPGAVLALGLLVPLAALDHWVADGMEWLTGNNAGGAAQIAGVILLVIFLLLALERVFRRNARFYRLSKATRPIAPLPLSGMWGWAAAAFCVFPFALGFVLPLLVMLGHAIKRPDVWVAPGLLPALGNTVLVGGIAAALTVLAALFLVYGTRMIGRDLARMVLPATLLGYAAPGAVLALGLLVPLAALDHWVADSMEWLTGYDPGLLMTGTSAAIVLAYFVRFFGIAQGALDAAFGRVSPSLPMAARSLGRSAGGALRDVYLPLMKGSVATALLVVFVDCVKELPATLLLRPFNFNTLSTRVFELASLEKLGEAAPAALLVMAVGLAAVGLLARATRPPKYTE